MSADRIQELFASALDQPPEHLNTFLQSECGPDAGLVRELKSLLAADAAAHEESIWQPQAALPSNHDADQPPDYLGRKIGPYRIDGLIGAGGMGTVYSAVREDSEYSQRVAIKLVKRGMDTDSIVRRFRHERQILAKLEHPSIARLLDGGTTDDGLPYLVMELIDGKPLNQYCRERGLSIHQLLRLFCAICSAVHYAHQHLVIHRDLKPGNILVTPGGVPKLLDFGIARILTSDAEVAETLSSEDRALTPGYASPEQIKGESITTASDVYSLGVILYEMLTGQSPYGAGKRTSIELMQAVCDQQPPRPSNADRQLRGDLDNIVLMALRKEKARRYASAEQFAEDVKRHLDLRPVKARGDGFSYVASRFIRRNWLATAAAALLALSLFTGIVATARAQARAERRFNDVRQLAHSFVFDYYDAIGSLPGATPIRQRMVKEGLRYLDSLSSEANNVSLERELLDTYVKISKVQGNTYESNMGDTAGATVSVQKAIAIGDKLLKQDRSAETFESLGQAYLDQAELLHGNNQLEPADKVYGDAISLTENGLKLKPGDTGLILQLARAERHRGDLNGADGTANLGRSVRAGGYYQRASILGEQLVKDHPDMEAAQRGLCDSYVAMAGLASTTGHREFAVQGYEKALSMIRAISARNPNSGDDRMEIAGTSIRLAREFMADSKPQQALPYFKDAETTTQALAQADPHNELYQRNLSVTEVHTGTALLKLGDPKGAIVYFTKAAELSSRLRITNPASVEIGSDLALAEKKLGQAFSDLGNASTAELHIERSLGLLRSMTLKSQDANLLVSLARTNVVAADLRLKAKHSFAALSYLEAAQKIYTKLAATDPANSSVRGELSATEAKLAECRRQVTP